MLLGVKKGNFIIYSSCLAAGITLIIFGILSYWKIQQYLVDEILLSLGCSTVPTVATAYLIDMASEKRQSKRIKSLRNNYLSGFIFGFLWIMKVAIEKYYETVSQKAVLFKDCFDSAIDTMKNIPFNAINQNKELNIIRNSSNLGYGVSLCVEKGRQILDSSSELLVNGLFSYEEIKIIEGLVDDCDTMMNINFVSDLGEQIKVSAYSAIESIPEIREKVNKKIDIENRRIIKFWTSLFK